MRLILLYFIFMNIIALLAMGVDKKKARKNKWRIPEKTLFLISILGGSVGSVLGMYLFHHKTQKWYFVLGMPVILCIHLLVLGGYLWCH